MQVKNANKHRQDTIAIAILCFVLQAGLSPNVGVVTGGVNFMLVFAAVYALSIGGRPAVIAGFVSGLLFDLVSTSPVGLMAALLTVLSYVLGFETRNRFVDGYVYPVTSYGIGSFCVLFAYSLTTSLVGGSANVGEILMLRVIPTFVITFLVFMVFARYMVRRATKGKGLGSGAGKSSSGLTSHYDVRGL